MNEQWIPVGGADVHVVRWGDGFPAPPGGCRTLLVHGLGGSALNWELVGDGLASATGGPVEAVDLPGFGASRPGARPATIDAQRELVTALLEARGPAVLVGNSMGGAIAVATAARRPDLVERLVLVDPALPPPLPRAPGVDWRFLGRFATVALPSLGGRALAWHARRAGAERLVDDQLRLVTHDPHVVPPALRARFVEAAHARAGNVELAHAFSTAARSLLRYLSGPFRRDAAAVRGPILLVHGDRDRLVPLPSAVAFARRRPDVHLEVVSPCGHAPQLEHPARFVELVGGWLDQHRPLVGGMR